jgi:hypothetical protein
MTYAASGDGADPSMIVFEEIKFKFSCCYGEPVAVVVPT